MKIGNNIRKLRSIKGYSQEFMALKLDMSQNNYSKIELGHISPTLDRIKQIAEILEISPIKLIEFDDSVIFNNINQQGGNAANNIHLEHSEKVFAMLEKSMEILVEVNKTTQRRLDKIDKELEILKKRTLN